jgi:hypothetical protein
MFEVWSLQILARWLTVSIFHKLTSIEASPEKEGFKTLKRATTINALSPITVKNDPLIAKNLTMVKVSSQKKMAARHFSDCQEEPSESEDFSSSMRKSNNENS